MMSNASRAQISRLSASSDRNTEGVARILASQKASTATRDRGSAQRGRDVDSAVVSRGPGAGASRGGGEARPRRVDATMRDRGSGGLSRGPRASATCRGKKHLAASPPISRARDSARRCDARSGSRSRSSRASSLPSRSERGASQTRGRMAQRDYDRSARARTFRTKASRGGKGGASTTSRGRARRFDSCSVARSRSLRSQASRRAAGGAAPTTSGGDRRRDDDTAVRPSSLCPSGARALATPRRASKRVRDDDSKDGALVSGSVVARGALSSHARCRAGAREERA